ncbi:unnamed protein product [Colias eurytheme]|nr:unnamed protein product [Colias eurytheme]
MALQLTSTTLEHYRNLEHRDAEELRVAAAAREAQRLAHRAAQRRRADPLPRAAEHLHRLRHLARQSQHAVLL